MSRAPDTGTARFVLHRGLAPRFTLLLADPRVTCAVSASCIEDTIDVRYREATVTCRLLRAEPEAGLLRCHFTAAHLARDGRVSEVHHWDLSLGGRIGSPAQRQALVRQFDAFHCAAAASRFRTGSRAVRLLGHHPPARPGKLAA